jgi:hypothetical protein
MTTIFKKQSRLFGFDIASVAVILVLANGCGRSNWSQNADQSDANATGEASSTASFLAGLPHGGTGNVTCEIFNLETYFQSIGCLAADGVTQQPCTAGSPNWSSLTPIGVMNMPNFDQANTHYTVGFTGFPSSLIGMNQWYGLRCTGNMQVSANTYTFTLASDDGSQLSIDGAMVALGAGTHSYEVDYYQGPKDDIALQLSWSTTSSSSSSAIVPASVFTQ